MNPARGQQRAFVSQAEAAEMLGVTERTIRNFVSRGELRAYKVGGRLVRIDVVDLEQLLRQIPAVSTQRGHA